MIVALVDWFSTLLWDAAEVVDRLIVVGQKAYTAMLHRLSLSDDLTELS